MNNKEFEKAKAVYDEQIAPLMLQIDKIVEEHGFHYVAAVQYCSYAVAASCKIDSQCDASLRRAWSYIEQATMWEDEE